MRVLSALIASSTSTGRHLFSAHTFKSRASSLAQIFTSRQSPFMASEDSLRQALASKLAEIEAQGNNVRALKASGAAKPDIDAAIEALNGLKLERGSIEKDLQAAVSSSGDGSVNRELFRQTVVNTLERRLFYIPSFKIYRGVAGLYDYGPPGCAVKANVLAFWRQVCY